MDFVLITFYVLAVLQLGVSIYIWFAIPFIWCVKVNCVVFTLYNLFSIGIICYCSVQELIVHEMVTQLNELKEGFMNKVIEKRVGKSIQICQEDTFELVFSKLDVGNIRNYAKFSSVVGWFSLIALLIYFSGYFATQRQISLAIESEEDRITLTRLKMDEKKQEEHKESSEDEYAITRALAIM